MNEVLFKIVTTENAKMRWITIEGIMDGEKIVMRILSQYVENLSMATLGMSSRNQEIINSASKTGITI